MFVTFIVPKGGASPEFSSVTASLDPPSQFPAMTDDAYDKEVVNLGAGTKLYAFGLPVTEEPGFLVPGQKVFLGVSSIDGFSAFVPIHTCIGYAWFFDQDPANVESFSLPDGTAYRGTVGGEVVILIPVVMS